MRKERLYALIMIIFIVGHAYLFYFLRQGEAFLETSVCPLKMSLGIPCPSCGSTRAVLALMSGSPAEALYINPVGIFTYLLGSMAAVMVFADLVSGRSIFYKKYQWAERKLLVKPYAYFFIVIILINWIWNITKGL